MPLIKEKRKKRGRKVQLNALGRASQLITIQGNKKAAENIAQRYLADYPEVANWDVDVQYSQNKNNRWKIAQSLKDTFTYEQSELAEEEMNVLALVVPDPNLVPDYHVKANEEIARYFMSNRESEIFVGKERSRVPGHEFDKSKDVKFTIEDEALEKSRTRSKGHPKNGFYMYKEGAKGKKSIYYTEESGEEETFSEEESEIEESDPDNLSTSPKELSLKDFLMQSQNISTVDQTNKPIQQSIAKSFKGKIFFDPTLIQEIKLDNNVENDEFEKIEELDASAEKVILFLEDIDPLASKDWETIHETKLERVTMINKPSGIILSLQPKHVHEAMIECELKITSLKTEDLTDILPLFSECRSVFEVSNLAQHLLGGRSFPVRSGINSNCYRTHEAGLNLLEIEVAKYEESISNEAIAVDDYCNVCFETGVQLDYCACGEGFCPSCWTMYLSSIKEMDKIIQCPGFDCAAPVPISILGWFLPNKNLKELLESIVDSSVKTDYNVHRCDRTLCKRIVFTDFKSASSDEKSSTEQGIKCVCGNHWCRWCGKDYHYPSSCQEKQDYQQFENRMKEWKSKETTVEVRPCPKCGIKWEKMWGCNYMMCSTCGTGFCWGCGIEHSDHNGICGSMKVPLEKVEILPFPTEKLSAKRIQSFQLHTELKSDNVLKQYKKEYEKIMKKFLTADKEFVFANFQTDFKSLLETERCQYIDEIVSRTINVCKQGSISLLNTLLKKSLSLKDTKRIKSNFFALKDLFVTLQESTPSSKNWKDILFSVDTQTKYFQKLLKIRLD